ncbi:MAG: hypothetical protein ACRD2U_08525 [Terriglobales bacterium]
MRLSLACLLLIISLSSLSIAQSPAGSVRLPVKRVVLYKNGMGYFEHSGRVNGNEDVNIDLTTAQLNDVLKSLTTLDLGKGRITGVAYNSIDPLNKRLGALRLPLGEDTTTAQFLDAMRGARIEVHSGSLSATGRLLSVEQRDLQGRDNQKITVDAISLVSDSGEVRTFDLTPETTVRIAEKDLNDEVGHYLSLVASTRDQDVRRLTISTQGTGERDLLVSYISEVPIWKSTYRIIIPKDGKPLLQGWAIVDNTVGEDWDNVELSLVAGAPQSFVQDLSQPYYARRPVVPMPENAMITPQTHEAVLEEKEEAAPPPPPSPAMAPASIHGSAGGVIGGILSSSANRAAIGGPVFKAQSINADALEQANNNVANSRELGDLFEYRLPDRVTIHKNQSALVPILQSRVDAEKVSVWNPADNYVLRALWLNNTSGLTLDGGSFNVLEDDAFAGEGLMDPIKPDEKRLLSYAADLGVLVDTKQKEERQKVTKVVINHGVLTYVSQEEQEMAYTVRDRDTTPRTVVIEHPIKENWKLDKEMQPDESTVSFHRFRLKVEPNTTATLVVKEYRPNYSRYELTNLNDDQIGFFLQQKMINRQVELALRKIVEQKNQVAALQADIDSRQAQITSIAEDQQRVRENMKALKGSVEEKTLVQRYARQLNQQEDQVDSLHKQISDLKQKRNEAQKLLNNSVQQLSLEAEV